jgi:hypothetical protein
MKYAVMDRTELDVELLYKAMKGMGTTETVLTEVMCTRSNVELHAVMKVLYTLIHTHELHAVMKVPFLKSISSLLYISS